MGFFVCIEATISFTSTDFITVTFFYEHGFNGFHRFYAHRASKGLVVYRLEVC